MTGACTKKRGVFIIQSFIQCLVIIYDIILVIFFALDFQTYDVILITHSRLECNIITKFLYCFHT